MTLDKQVAAALSADPENTDVMALGGGVPTGARDLMDAIEVAVSEQYLDGAYDDTPFPDDYERGTNPDQRWGCEVYISVHGEKQLGYLYPIAVHRDGAGDIIITVADGGDVLAS